DYLRLSPKKVLSCNSLFMFEALFAMLKGNVRPPLWATPRTGRMFRLPRTRRRARPVLVLVACGFLIAGTIAVGAKLILSDLENRALANHARELQNIVLVLAEQTDRTLQAIELLQKSLIAQIQSEGVVTSAEYTRLMSSRDVHLMLKEKIRG